MRRNTDYCGGFRGIQAGKIKYSHYEDLIFARVMELFIFAKL